MTGNARSQFVPTCGHRCSRTELLVFCSMTDILQDVIHFSREGTMKAREKGAEVVVQFDVEAALCRQEMGAVSGLRTATEATGD